jgi:hypothetical protein
MRLRQSAVETGGPRERRASPLPGPDRPPPAIRAEGLVRSGHLRSRFESCSISRMTCEECGQEAIGRAEGWEALLIDLDDDGQDEVVFYCPVCAEREFHAVE